MFTAPAPSPPTISTSTSPASPTTPTRSGRLRGLSYLRSYTQNHLHLHSSASSGASTRPQLSRSTSHPSSSNSSSQPYSLADTERVPTTRTQSRALNLRPSTTSLNSTSGWFPAGGGRSGVSRAPAQSDSVSTDPVATRSRSKSSVPRRGSSPAVTMTRNGSSSAVESITRPTAPHTVGDTRARGESAPNLPRNASQVEQMPLIRFIPFQEPRSSRPSLNFSPVSRTLPSSCSVIRVGRYSERENNPEIPENVPSAAPIGFKSKVVSRRHCEFWCQNGQWYIKDVQSSSGTFLNHIRLSKPGVESKPYKVQDGDIVQLGIDFRGGEEMIFRCVKIRIECNRGWQKGLNSFNKTTHKRIRNLAKSTSQADADSASTHTSECAICLMSIAPCQSLFVAPCSHVWHYKCVRPMLNAQDYPNFQCPNCRAMADLEADVDEPPSDFEEDWEEAPAEAQENDAALGAASSTAEESTVSTRDETDGGGGDGADDDNHSISLSQLGGISLQLDDALASPIPDTTLHVPRAIPVPIATGLSVPSGSKDQATPPGSVSQYALARAETAAPDGPMTPRNDAGPFILDGSAGRAERRTGIGNLESVVQED